jgi:branched-chain amino acid transport system substrate-binding protein
MSRHSRATTKALTVLLVLIFILSGWSRRCNNLNQAAAAADSGEKNGVTSTEVLLGSCAPLTKALGEAGKQSVGHAKAYLDYINDQGGVHGRKIKLVSYDDCYEPEKGVECFDQIVNKDKVFAAVFFVGSATAAKYVRMAESNHIPIVGILSGASFLHAPFKPYVFAIRTSYDHEYKIIVDHLWKDLNARKIAVIYQNDALGAAVLSAVNTALATHGTTPVAVGSFTRNVENIDDPLASVRSANPDVVLVAAVYGGLAKFCKACETAGWHPLIVTGSHVDAEEFVKRAGKEAEGVVSVQVVPPVSRDDLPTVTLYKKILKKYAPTERPTIAGLEGFVNAMVVVEGLKRAGNDLTRSKFMDGLESIHNLDIGLGPTFKLNYSPNQHKGFDCVCYTVVRKGITVEFTDWKEIKKPQ